jgi:hypothetical protein
MSGGMEDSVRSTHDEHTNTNAQDMMEDEVTSSIPQGQPCNWTEQFNTDTIHDSDPQGIFFDIHDDPDYLENDKATTVAAKHFNSDYDDYTDSNMEVAEECKAEGAREINKRNQQRVQDEDQLIQDTSKAIPPTKPPPAAPAATAAPPTQPIPAFDVTAIASQFMSMLGTEMAKLKTHMNDCTHQLEEAAKKQREADMAKLEELKIEG